MYSVILYLGLRLLVALCPVTFTSASQLSSHASLGEIEYGKWGLELGISLPPCGKIEEVIVGYFPSPTSVKLW